MFDVTSDDIAQLDDTRLRELVGRLCEAELERRGLSPAFANWGGDQTAPDGGLDVRVALPAGTVIDGYIPRPATGFQVKKSDMPKGAIIKEMRPKDVLRPVIEELAKEGGAYIIVTANGSLADSARQHRLTAMREALGADSAAALHVDVYDRTRLAGWVRSHPGLVAWVRLEAGRPLSGWQPYGAWSCTAENGHAEYLLDDRLRLHIDGHSEAPAPMAAETIDRLRDMIAEPRRVVRLVGLSGVGKTRLVQALFDDRIGTRPLPRSEVIYTDSADGPSPTPTAMAEDLIANRRRTILIVDNCPPDLHRRLANVCIAENCTISVLTVEYDVREDQPEETEVVRLDTSSPELIEALIARRHPHVSPPDRRVIAEASDGNARLALAIAGTVKTSQTLAGLSDNDLFGRLFHQRHPEHDDLLRAAKACALVYSFDGETLSGDEAELPRIAELAGQSVQQLTSNVAELARRGLVQKRGRWRAALPHALANRLAKWALEETPHPLIDHVLITGGTDRLARSFSQRLSFLHTSPEAVSIVGGWLAPGGMLGDVATLNDLGRAMFENVAPVAPEAALAALERVEGDVFHRMSGIWQGYISLLRSLAYDPPLFDRSVIQLIRAAISCPKDYNANDAATTFASLFRIYLSGTHASVEQRFNIIEALLCSKVSQRQSLGLNALNEALTVGSFMSSGRFDFGARSRDYGYFPHTDESRIAWYRAALSLIEKLATSDTALRIAVCHTLAQNLRDLWALTPLQHDLDRLCRRIAVDGFWRDGWIACRQIVSQDASDPTSEGASRLRALVSLLRPTNLADQVRAVVFGDISDGIVLSRFDQNDNVGESREDFDAMARDFGTIVAADDAVLTHLLPEILRGGHRIWSFGAGLCSASANPGAMWIRLVEGLALLPRDEQNVQILKAYLAELWIRDQNLAQDLLDSAANHPVLVRFIPWLQSSVPLDARGVGRLKQSLQTAQAPISMYGSYTLDGLTNDVAGKDLKDLILLIADDSDGFNVALDILQTRLQADLSARRGYEPDLIQAGQDLLQRIPLGKDVRIDDWTCARVAEICLIGPAGASVVETIVLLLKKSLLDCSSYISGHRKLLEACFKFQAEATLDTLLVLDPLIAPGHYFDSSTFSDREVSPLDSISCNILIRWCDKDPKHRYIQIAQIITFTGSAPEGLTVWSDQARALIDHTPDTISVLSIFVERFRPTIWSGSRATQMQACIGLLDTLGPDTTPDLLTFIAQERRKLLEDIEAQRHEEAGHGRRRYERFE